MVEDMIRKFLEFKGRSVNTQTPMSFSIHTDMTGDLDLWYDDANGSHEFLTLNHDDMIYELLDFAIRYGRMLDR